VLQTYASESPEMGRPGLSTVRRRCSVRWWIPSDRSPTSQAVWWIPRRALCFRGRVPCLSRAVCSLCVLYVDTLGTNGVSLVGSHSFVFTRFPTLSHISSCSFVRFHSRRVVSRGFSVISLSGVVHASLVHHSRLPIPHRLLIPVPHELRPRGLGL